jgi:membrane protein implicated in regulation of membrane protease activity
MFSLQIALPPVDSFWWLAIVFLIIALIAVIVIGFLFAFPIAALAAIITYFLTGGSIHSLTGSSLLYAGIVFLVVALISAAIGNLAGYGRRRTVVVVHEEHHDDQHH